MKTKQTGTRRVLSLCTLLCAVTAIESWADTVYVAGQTYFGRNAYIEYYAGNLPYIVSAPHGGLETPDEIPDRTWGTMSHDTRTQDAARAFISAVVARTGGHPHVIICRLHRRKLDANRDSVEAAQGNPFALQAWQEYHRFVESARRSVTDAWRAGLYIDLHGHGHSIQRLELGYLLSPSQLALPDNSLNQPSVAASASIRTLAISSPEKLSGLLRGPRSLGTYFENRGYPAVPSTMQPHPGSDPYFTGGYNTQRHGSVGGGMIDGVQIEANYSGVRDTPTNVDRFAATLAEIVDFYTAVHHLGRTVTPAALVINEVLFDLPLDDTLTAIVEGDANGDGIRSIRADEFVEIVNTGPATAALGGYRLLERSMSTVYTFPDSATLGPGEYAVVFGGVGPAGFGASIPAGARVFAAQPGRADSGFHVSASKTNFLNAGDNVVLLEPRSNEVLDELCWGSAMPRTTRGRKLIPPNTLLGDSIAGPIAQAVTRSPDVTGLWAKSLDLPSGNAPYTPGLPAVTSVSPIAGRQSPADFALGQNYPNPFNPSTRLQFSLAVSARTRLLVHDILGRAVAVLLDEPLDAGTYEATFDAAHLPGGVYFCTLETGTWSSTRKMILLK